MSKRGKWVAAFLSVTALALVLEVWASYDKSPDTVPWTDLIVQYIPGEITALLIGGLCLWLVVHFGIRYWRKHKGDKANETRS